VKRILLTGGTGLIGGALRDALLRRGDAVSVFTRDPARVKAPAHPSLKWLAWEAERRGAWFEQVSGYDAIVHLAGEQAVGARWSDELKRRIRDSRVRSAELLVDAMREARERPSVFVCASGVGYFGALPASASADETAPPGDDFLARVCVEWEAAAARAGELGVRVVSTRFGIVLAERGGALEQMVLPFKLFAGGPIGSGEQIVSWVHAEDVVEVLLLAIDTPALSGPVNVAAPGAVSNAELARAIGEVLRRPSWLPVPAAALRLRFGEGADPLLTGQRAVPAALERAGYRFRHPSLRPALASVLG
jgi:uncharacterized protein